MYHSLRDLHWNALSATEKKSFKIIRVTTTQCSSQLPPTIAPYDFGICPAWWAANKSKHGDLLCDWYKYGDPDGFVANASVGQGDRMESDEPEDQQVGQGDGTEDEELEDQQAGQGDDMEDDDDGQGDELDTDRL
jgi:hypothetical protein